MCESEKSNEELKAKILKLVTEEPGLYPADLAKRLGISHLRASDITTEMVRAGDLGTNR